MKAERAYEGGRSFIVRDDDGKRIRSLTFRDALALAACRDGRVTARARRRYSYGFVDEDLVPECEFYGIAYGTLSGLQRDDWMWTALITRPDGEGPLALTTFGAGVLDAILAIPGVSFEAVVA